ncbi:MAG: DUF1150 domain-containing protein [Hyphomicrobiaceae bacterium]|nr:MAG: DUF1150 domain-containing protein [Hyphomicrobiaceae bacterium]
MSEAELGKLGGGDVAYIKEMTSEEAIKLYPGVKDLPPGVNLFALHHADGTPIALTDSRNAAIGHAIEDELVVHSVH